MAREKAKDPTELAVDVKLKNLYNLQTMLSEIDGIKTLRGELPLEVQDLEDEIEGLHHRLVKYDQEIKDFEAEINAKQQKINESRELMDRYKSQLDDVRNNREYESLSKEIEYQKLQIQVIDKHRSKFEDEIQEKERLISDTQIKLSELEEILGQKKAELEVIVADTEKEEAQLLADAEILKAKVDQRLLTAFERIRKNARNGLAIVKIQRDACGGCFSKIPPQRQLDIALHKKIIVCEACGRIFIDDKLVNSQLETNE